MVVLGGVAGFRIQELIPRVRATECPPVLGLRSMLQNVWRTGVPHLQENAYAYGRTLGRAVRVRDFEQSMYRGTSLIRNRLPLGP